MECKDIEQTKDGVPAPRLQIMRFLSWWEHGLMVLSVGEN